MIVQQCIKIILIFIHFKSQPNHWLSLRYVIIKIRCMNKTRIIGLILLIIGIALYFYFKNEEADFVGGLIIGIGIGLLFTGKTGNKK